MRWGERDLAQGLDALRAAVLEVLAAPTPAPAGAAAFVRPTSSARAGRSGLLLSEATETRLSSGLPGSGGYDDADLATSSEDDEAERERLIALVELARGATRTPSGCCSTTTTRRSTGSSTTAPARRPWLRTWPRRRSSGR